MSMVCELLSFIRMICKPSRMHKFTQICNNRVETWDL
jgi:hypothetical protein